MVPRYTSLNDPEATKLLFDAAAAALEIAQQKSTCRRKSTGSEYLERLPYSARKFDMTATSLLHVLSYEILEQMMMVYGLLPWAI